MDIHIEAPGHPNFAELETYYRTTINNRYHVFEFVKTLMVTVVTEKSGFTVKIKAELERDPRAFVSATHAIEDKAFKNALQKLDQLIRRYKSKHYHGI